MSCLPCGRLVLLVFSMLPLSVSPSRADWEYTKWGMTPEQVALASKGTVKVIPADKRTHDLGDDSEMGAQGKYSANNLVLDVGFMFDKASGGLNCVLYNSLGDDAVKLGASLVSRFGAPAKESDFMSSHTSAWTKPDVIEYTLGRKPLAAVVTHCAPGK